MTKRVLLLSLLCCLFFGTWAQNTKKTFPEQLLRSGPMLGYAEMKEVMLWVQTHAEADVKIKYWDKDKPTQVFETKTIKTLEERAFTAHLVADKVQPSREYAYELWINDKKVERPYPLTFKSQRLWQFREEPPTIRFAFGSCHYVNEKEVDRPDRPFGSGYGIFENIRKQNPDFMLWLGDNVYFREADWGTKTGILHRYSHTRQISEIQPFLASVHQYAIWDDHDYGSNDADRSYPYKELSFDAFRYFWANPNYNLTGKGGITGMFTWGDIDFFLLDNRYFRTPNKYLTDPKRGMLGEEQVAWLLDALAASNAPFKFIAIGGQMITDAAIFENYPIYEKERQYLFDAIKQANIDGVVFLTGDRHHSVAMKKDREGTYPFYEFTSSPLTSSVYGQNKEPNESLLNIEGSYHEKQSFGIIEISGARKERVLKIFFHDNEGKELWKMEIKAQDLKSSKK